MTSLENSWGEYILAVNAFNDKLQKKYDKELKEEIAEYEAKPWWFKWVSREPMWIEMGNAIRLARAWKEATVEDCLTWLANNKSFV